MGMVFESRRITIGVTLFLIGCASGPTGPAPTPLRVSAAPALAAPGDTVVVTFTNTGTTELFVNLGCFTIERRYGST